MSSCDRSMSTYVKSGIAEFCDRQTFSMQQQLMQAGRRSVRCYDNVANRIPTTIGCIRAEIKRKKSEMPIGENQN